MAERKRTLRFGEKVPAKGSRPPEVGGKPGWYEDPEAPGLQRYWTGTDWRSDVAPRSTPEPAFKQARVIALGILMAIGVVWFIWNAQQPSETECSIQRLEYLSGKRLLVDVDDACRL